MRLAYRLLSRGYVCSFAPRSSPRRERRHLSSLFLVPSIYSRLYLRLVLAVRPRLPLVYMCIRARAVIKHRARPGRRRDYRLISNNRPVGFGFREETHTRASLPFFLSLSLSFKVWTRTRRSHRRSRPMIKCFFRPENSSRRVERGLRKLHEKRVTDDRFFSNSTMCKTFLVA